MDRVPIQLTGALPGVTDPWEYPLVPTEAMTEAAAGHAWNASELRYAALRARWGGLQPSEGGKVSDCPEKCSSDDSKEDAVNE